jgi:hypothetical protein
MKRSVQFYRDVLGMELLFGGETAGFSSLRARETDSAILNLEKGVPVDGWAGSSSMSRTWTRSGDVSVNWDFSLKSRGMLLGANGTSICSIPRRMSCRLRDR